MSTKKTEEMMPATFQICQKKSTILRKTKQKTNKNPQLIPCRVNQRKVMPRSTKFLKTGGKEKILAIAKGK